MNVLIDPSIHLKVSNLSIEKIKTISEKLKNEFKNLDYSSTVKQIILKEHEKKDGGEGWFCYEFNNGKIINFNSSAKNDVDSIQDLDQLRETITEYTPVNFLKNHSVSFAFFAHSYDETYIHKEIKNQYLELVNHASSVPDLRETIYFQFGPNFFLPEHTDSEENCYTFLINLSVPNEEIGIKVNTHVTKLKDNDVFLFDAGTGVHSAWNSSGTKNWEFLCVRINESFFDS